MAQGQKLAKQWQGFFRPEEPAVCGNAEGAIRGKEKSQASLPQTGLDQELVGESFEVRNFFQLIPSLLAELKEEVSLFQGGRLQQFIEDWKLITSDSEILQTVSGLCLEFDCQDNQLPLSFPSQPRLNEHEINVINVEIDKLCKKGVIAQCFEEPGQFVSPVFVHPRKDGTHRMILNLKCLNADIILRWTHYRQHLNW